MTKRKSASKPSTPSANRQQKAPRNQTLALNSSRDAIKRQTIAIADPRGIPKERALPKARPRVAGKAEPSMLANQMLETLFKWTPLGFLMRYQELERARAERYLEKRIHTNSR